MTGALACVVLGDWYIIDSGPDFKLSDSILTIELKLIVNKVYFLFKHILITIYFFISAENIKVFLTKIRHRILQPSNLGFFFWHVLLNCKKQTDKRLLMKGKGFTILHPPKYTVYPVGPNPPNFCTTKKNSYTEFMLYYERKHFRVKRLECSAYQNQLKIKYY